MKTFLDKLAPREYFGYLIGAAVARRDAKMHAARCTDHLPTRTMHAKHAREWNRNAVRTLREGRELLVLQGAP